MQLSQQEAFRINSIPQLQNDKQLSQPRHEYVLYVLLPFARVEPLSETHVEALDEQRNHHAHLR